MNLHSFLTKHFNETRKLMIDSICEHIEIQKTKEIELTTNVVYQFIDEQECIIISRVNCEKKSVILTDGISENELDIDELSFDQILFILGEIEKNKYTIYEEIETV